MKATKQHMMRSDRRHRTPAATMRQRGSILILVVVAITMLALLGAVYLQVARVQRERTTPVRGNMKAEIAAIIAQINSTLKDSLTDNDSHKFSLYDYPWTNNRQAWTDSSGNAPTGIDGNPISNPAPRGNYQDDAWLASSAPVDVNNQAEWPHLTNLNGYYLDYNGQSNSFPTNSTGNPQQLGVNDASASTDNVNNDINWIINMANHGQLVDADGDGIPDSRWTYGALPQIGPVKYVMAVRIVDLSGKVDVNTATSLVNLSGSNLGQYDTSTNGADAPRWDTPAEIDLGSFVYDLGGKIHSQFINNLASMFYYRDGGGTLPSTGLIPYNTGNASRQKFYWRKNGRYYTNLVTTASANSFEGNLYDPDNKDGTNNLTNEYQLLRRNGLSQTAAQGAANPADVPIEAPYNNGSSTGMPNFLRAQTGSTPVETKYSGVNVVAKYGAPSPSGTAQQIQNYFAYEPRHQMTTLGGAAVFAWPTSTTNKFDPTDNPYPANNAFQLGLNYQLGLAGNSPYKNAPQSGMANVANRIEAVYQDSNGPPAGFEKGQSAAQREADFAGQLTANLRDYGDSDSYITKFTYNGKDFYGMEALPYICEVYVEGKYPAPSNPTKSGGDWQLTWNLQKEPGFAIEIRNPYPYAIDLTNVYLYIGTTKNGKPATWGSQYALSTLAGKNTLQANGVLVLYQQAGDGSNAPDDNPGLAKGGTPPGLVTEEAGYPYVIPPKPIPAATYTWPTQAQAKKIVTTQNPTLQNVYVELHATVKDVSTGQTATADWAYDRVSSNAIPKTYVDESVSTTEPKPSGGPYYWQIDRSGDGRGLEMVALPDSKFNLTNDAPYAAPDYNHFNSIYKLGRADKGNTFASANTKLETQRIFISNGPLIKQVGELMHLSWLAPTAPVPTGQAPTETTAEVWQQEESAGNHTSNQSIDDFLLNFTPSSSSDLMKDASDDCYKVTPATFLLSEFSTINPRVDQVDNDGDGITDNNKSSGKPGNENIITGLVNINTAPESLLKKILPIPDTALRDYVAQWIVEYRDNGKDGAPSRATMTGLNSSNVRQDDGIAYIGELEPVFENELKVDASAFTNSKIMVGKDTSTITSIHGTRTDFIDPATANGTATAYSGSNVQDRKELATLLTRWLSTVTTTRSDYYAAYVLVRGYYGGFNQSDILESAQFIAVFRRNSVNGKIQVTALLPNGSDSQPYMVTSP